VRDRVQCLRSGTFISDTGSCYQLTGKHCSSERTMPDERSDVSKIVTAFLLNTCRLPPRINHHNVQAAARCTRLAGRGPSDDDEHEFIPLITGSIAEFYIEPMLPLVGDIDVMSHVHTQLAIPQGHPLPTQLPAEFHDLVLVFDIFDSHFPGFVYLESHYLLHRCIDDGKYKCFRYNEGHSYSNRANRGHENVIMHGPAVFSYCTDILWNLSVDDVHCIRCLVWPPQASAWPTRLRNYGWPDSATVDRVVGNGCDLVGAVHRLCRQHEVMEKYQWRLSFSRAEIVLLNSWMPVQQIVYHMLRYFKKNERLTDCADNSGAGTLSSYHIKTLMLWACELKSRSWWTENLNLVRICVELLHTLSDWLTDTRCPHYFVNNCNLLDNSLNMKNVANKLMPMDEKYLSTWFIANYIGACAQICPVHVLRVIDDASSNMKLQTAVSEIVRWRLNTSLYDLWQAVYFEEFYLISSIVLTTSLNVRSCDYWMNEFTKIDKRFSVYFSAFALLHVARRISRNGFTDNDMDILSAILRHECSGVLSLSKAGLNTSEHVELLQKSAVEHLTTYRQLVARDFGSVVTIVTTDYEAMYAYKPGEYHRCLQLSTPNVHTMLYAGNMPDVPTFPEFIQLLDDDIVSLTALTLIIDPKCRLKSHNACITQLTVSVYLMTQCQLKLHYSMKSLAQTLHCIKVAQVKHLCECTLNHLTLKMIERKVYLTTWH